MIGSYKEMVYTKREDFGISSNCKNINHHSNISLPIRRIPIDLKEVNIAIKTLAVHRLCKRDNFYLQFDLKVTCNFVFCSIIRGYVHTKSRSLPKSLKICLSCYFTLLDPPPHIWGNSSTSM